MLGNLAWQNYPYHEPKWCPATLTECDSTRLDATVDFDWGSHSPVEGMVAPNSFPENSFSARWVGEVMGPATGSVTFVASADDGIRLTVNGVALFDALEGLDASTISGAIDMVEGELYAIVVEIGRAHV